MMHRTHSRSSGEEMSCMVKPTQSGSSHTIIKYSYALLADNNLFIVWETATQRHWLHARLTMNRGIYLPHLTSSRHLCRMATGDVPLQSFQKFKSNSMHFVSFWPARIPFFFTLLHPNLLEEHYSAGLVVCGICVSLLYCIRLTRSRSTQEWL